METLKIVEDCKDKKIKRNVLDEFHKSINEVEIFLDGLEKEE